MRGDCGFGLGEFLALEYRFLSAKVELKVMNLTKKRLAGG
jgi:hypothetical protein